MDVDAIQIQACNRCIHFFAGSAKSKKCGNRHIAADTARTIKIEIFHKNSD